MSRLGEFIGDRPVGIACWWVGAVLSWGCPSIVRALGASVGLHFRLHGWMPFSRFPMPHATLYYRLCNLWIVWGIQSPGSRSQANSDSPDSPMAMPPDSPGGNIWRGAGDGLVRDRSSFSGVNLL
ncbi:hypothetical protein [Phormidium sp. CCY1219]|uniref:hypothetical protein n=1 Tax=Phormidium sp. CCY1219 TaxID=2886104 RepID=UPI002D1F0DE1|nr:hypothetical protein [Phormidium sp. CCY1219]MEB3831236.1 hypothetical protein [Phormidium sp. CCY1219]